MDRASANQLMHASYQLLLDSRPAVTVAANVAAAVAHVGSQCYSDGSPASSPDSDRDLGDIIINSGANAAAAAAAAHAKGKPVKRQRSSSPELLRCKRRLSFTGLGYSLPQQQPAAVARRNERERNRVKLVNMGFQTLRQHVPNGAANKKMSKVETLRSAVEYIRALQQLLDEHDAVSAAFPGGVPSPTLSPAYSATDLNSIPASPLSTYSSEEGSYEALSPEEQELLDFTSWFDRY
eukprot:gi/632973202/ref/XP_007903037.1/ PREDICTED: achaete-scute homolog 1-like [Callorhinchus milii]